MGFVTGQPADGKDAPSYTRICPTSAGDLSVAGAKGVSLHAGSVVQALTGIMWDMHRLELRSDDQAGRTSPPPAAVGREALARACEGKQVASPCYDSVRGARAARMCVHTR